MNNQKIIDGNRVIAEFMGIKILTKKEYAKMTNCPIEEIINMPEQNVYYHSSWDWLMPVIDKIESLDLRKNGYDFPKVKFLGDHIEIFIYATYRSDYIYWQPWVDLRGNWHNHPKQCNSKIEAAYKAVIDFIKWYNKNKKL